MQHVLVVDANRNPLMPCHPARARKLLKGKRAAVLRRYPFTIILKDREGGDVQPIALKVDPGSKTSGVALVAEGKHGKRVVWAAEATHRGQQIKDALDSRRSLRRSRRNRKTRYRPARFDNRRRAEGWLPPSIQSRVDNLTTWANRLYQFTPITSASIELVKFDMQAMQNPEISGVEYQQGELAGYEVREYLLEKWARKCAYCGAKDTPLEVEHINPKSRGGSNRVSNLTLACRKCNEKKGNKTAAEFGFPDIQRKAKAPLKDAAAVNAARWKLYRVFVASGLPVEVGTGGRTKFNRVKQGYPKTHWLDAACVGESGERVYADARHAPLLIKATGHGRRQRCQTDKYGFPKAHAQRKKSFMGFRTGDIVKAEIPKGKYAGKHGGRITIRFSPNFTLNGFGVHPKYLGLVHFADGYGYARGDTTRPTVSRRDYELTSY